MFLFFLQQLLTIPNLKGSELLYSFLTSECEFTTSFLADLSLGKGTHFLGDFGLGKGTHVLSDLSLGKAHVLSDRSLGKTHVLSDLSLGKTHKLYCYGDINKQLL